MSIAETPKNLYMRVEDFFKIKFRKGVFLLTVKVGVWIKRNTTILTHSLQNEDGIEAWR